ncbi:hypothetical protein GLAREA_04167 [Glarea lozoyensis ATCC 20868]|uniref:F-box domain-containing protein n=1 Tax=Glarea lozoyensis (strain ATCC 20868 / MF5171) TaxID=1116229 RepID=S3D024_GLAL2|nr:uncharacterized protein GLAREA_04167 [Glarea lozoyensis ATCC 20868]EPE31200.1 hypothetical protein GLAREA_04167 [Glarea lozoyensis ATCC 20868]
MVSQKRKSVSKDNANQAEEGTGLLPPQRKMLRSYSAALKTRIPSLHADQPWIARLPIEILSIIIQSALDDDQEYYDPDTLNVKNVKPKLMYGFIPKDDAYRYAPVCSLLKAFPRLRSEILKVFFSRKVDLINITGEAGLEFLQSLSASEIETYPRQLCVPWYGRQSDVAFRRLARCKNLKSLQVLIKDDSHIHRIAKLNQSLDRCPGWDSIMSIRGCKETSLVVVAFRPSTTQIHRVFVRQVRSGARIREQVLRREFTPATQYRMDIAGLERLGVVSYVDMARLMQTTCSQPRLQQSEGGTG